ncbi:6840_t:CDS:2, partial [Acaulospora colombiana]
TTIVSPFEESFKNYPVMRMVLSFGDICQTVVAMKRVTGVGLSAIKPASSSLVETPVELDPANPKSSLQTCTGNPSSLFVPLLLPAPAQYVYSLFIIATIVTVVLDSSRRGKPQVEASLVLRLPAVFQVASLLVEVPQAEFPPASRSLFQRSLALPHPGQLSLARSLQQAPSGSFSRPPPPSGIPSGLPPSGVPPSGVPPSFTRPVPTGSFSRPPLVRNQAKLG